MRTVHGQLCQLQPLMRTSHLVQSKLQSLDCNVSGPTKFQTTTSTGTVFNLTGTRHRPRVQTFRKPKIYWTYLNSFKKSLHIPQVIAGHAMSSCPTLFSIHQKHLARGIRPQRQHVHCPLSQSGLIVTVTETLNVRLQPTELHLWDPCYALRTARFCGTPWVTMWYTMYFLLTALCFDMFLFQGVGDAISCSAFSHWDASHWTGTPKWPKRVRRRETVQCAKISENIRKYPKIMYDADAGKHLKHGMISICFDSGCVSCYKVLASSGLAAGANASLSRQGRGWLGDDRTENIGSEIFSSDCQDFSSDCSNDSESFRSLRGKIRYRVSKPDFQTSNSWFPYSISSQHLAQSSWELPTLRVTASASTASEDAALGDRDTKWYEGFEHPIGDTKNSSAKQIGDGRRQLKISNIDYSWLFCQSAVSESHDESSAIACAEAPSNSKWNISVVVLKKG